MIYANAIKSQHPARHRRIFFASGDILWHEEHMQMRRIYFSICNRRPQLTRDRAKRPPTPAIGRVRALSISCLLSYLVAHLLVMDIGRMVARHGNGTLPPDATQLGYMIAIGCLPLLILTCFGMWVRYRGIIAVGILGAVAALAGTALP
ncbi:hypothetical protein CFR71_07715 [Novacetimonas pomaceti]|uniref:Uncharacterized protein n=2 Tax=Novacetimonas pomaceti TaxID=2021998 RepID=A0A318QCX8_9PROT|nr:hypothetical protein CFR71_07715 [Novacetimonas pomaceti]